MAEEKSQTSTPSEPNAPITNIPGPKPEYEAQPHAENVNVDYDRKRKLRVGLLALIALLLAATTGGYAYLYQNDQQIIAKLNTALATNTTPKPASSPTSLPKSAVVVRNNPKLAASANPQVLTIKEWGVKLTLPSNANFPAPTYAILPKGVQANDSAGFTNGNLSKFGGTCVAAGAPLGLLVRMKAGSFPTGGSSVSYVATVGGYDYGYVAPQSICDKAPANSSFTVDSGLHQLLGALNTLDPAN